MAELVKAEGSLQHIKVFNDLGWYPDTIHDLDLSLLTNGDDIDVPRAALADLNIDVEHSLEPFHPGQ